MENQFAVERAISSFDKNSGELVQTHIINLSLEQIKTIFIPYPNDPLLYYCYNITPEQANRLADIDNTISLDTESFDYELECSRIGV